MKKVCGIVAEYNPFHNGHRRHIELTREALGADAAVVCVMSGSFVQRGAAAVYGKRARAEAALRCGADLVLELPVPWALSSAEGFAGGAVSVLASTGVVTHLSFGSECGDPDALRRTAELLLRPELDGRIRAELEKGVSYAAARQAAAEALSGGPLPLLRAPNDLLGLEYLKAMRRLSSPITPLAVRREGAGHDAPEAAGERLPSASALRERLAAGLPLTGAVPAAAEAVYRQETEQGRGPVLPEALETAMMSRLRALSPEDFAALPGAGEGLEHRLYRAAAEEPTLKAILAAAATRRYALSRLRRMLCCACLGITRADSRGTPPYLRVLGAGPVGRALLAEMRETAEKPVLTKPAAVRALSPAALRVFALEAAATDLRALGRPDSSRRRGGEEWRFSPVIVPGPDG